MIHFKGLFFKGELQIQGQIANIQGRIANIQGRIAIRPYTPAHAYFSQTIFD